MALKCSNERERETAMRAATTNDGRSLWDLSEESTLLVIFLRHFGCTFCRETLGFQIPDYASESADNSPGLDPATLDEPAPNSPPTE